jgi:hypothetical protein
MCVVPAHAGLIYNTLPGVLPVDSVFSWGYEAQSVSEFGGLIAIAPGSGDLNSAQVLLSNWSYESAYEPLNTSAGYTVPVTLTLYNVGPGNTVGSSIVSSTSSVFVPWRAEPDGINCPATPINGSPYLQDGNCYSGVSVLASFAFDTTTLPANAIYGLSFNTQASGYSPVGSPGPYNGLNFGLTTSDPSVGTNPLPDTGYLNTTDAALYFDGGAGGTGTFRQDQNYTAFGPCPGDPNSACVTGHYSGAIALSDVVITPEPGTIALMLIGLAGLGRVKFLKRRS